MFLLDNQRLHQKMIRVIDDNPNRRGEIHNFNLIEGETIYNLKWRLSVKMSNAIKIDYLKKVSEGFIEDVKSIDEIKDGDIIHVYTTFRRKRPPPKPLNIACIDRCRCISIKVKPFV